MRSTILIVCLLWAAVCVHALTRVERPNSVHKRAASPQVYRGPPNSTYANNNQTQQFQWVKVNNQWVRKDGTALPTYSQANVPYNQTRNQWNTPTPNQRPGNQSASAVGGGWGQQPKPQTPQQPVQQRPQTPVQQLPRQNSTSQGGLGWNPNDDRALTQDRPQTTPRPTYTTPTPAPFIPQTPPPAYNPPSSPQAGPPPANRPFGSGLGPNTNQRPPGGQQNSWNPDASLTYGGRTPPPQAHRPQPTPNTGRAGTNPWAGIFSRLL